jgi:hypothetical protein
MNRLKWGIFAAGALVAAGAVASSGCASNSFDQVGLTKDAAVVANCQKLDEVSVKASTPADQVDEALSNAARSKGANYVLVQSGSGDRTGTAYRCAAPAVATGAAATGR